MKQVTYFYALELCKSEMESAIRNRGSDLGIAVEKDHHSMLYRIRDRQYRKLRARVINALGAKYEYCWKCGYRLVDGKCPINCRNQLPLMNPYRKHLAPPICSVCGDYVWYMDDASKLQCTEEMVHYECWEVHMRNCQEIECGNAD